MCLHWNDLILKLGLHKMTAEAFHREALLTVLLSQHITQHFNIRSFSMHGSVNSCSSWGRSAPLNSYQISLCGRRFFPESYPIYLRLWDAVYASVEVQMFLSGEQIVQCVHLRTVADSDALAAALHDVDNPPGGNHTERQIVLSRISHMLPCRW